MKGNGTLKKLKRIWFKALGNKASECDTEADQIAMMRTFLFMFVIWSAFVDLFIFLNIATKWFR